MKASLSALIVAAVAGLAGAVSCGGSDKAATDPTVEVGCTLTELHITPASANLHPGDSLHVVAVYTPCVGVAQTVLLRWRSSDTTVATVANDGLVRAYSRGRATIIGALPSDPNILVAMALAVE